MKRITPNRIAIFIGVMSAVALCLYLLHFEQARRRAQATVQAQRAAAKEAATQEAAETARARRVQFLDRYLNVRFGKNPAVMTVAVAAASEDGKLNRPVTDALVSRLKNENVELISFLFKPAFFADGMFAKVFAGSSDAINQLGLPRMVNGLLLAQEAVEYSTNTILQNVISASLQLKVESYPFTESDREATWTFRANGTGLSPQLARANAEQFLIKEIAADTHMSLVPLSSDHPDLYP